MPDHGSLSPAQLVGYLAFALGVLSFSQKDDRRLKGTVAFQAASYAIHFALLGSITAASSSVVTLCRAVLSLYTRSPWVAALLIAANVAIGVTFGRSASAWLPIVASSIGTLAFFYSQGVKMRVALLGATSLWLTNNLLLGSIGGTFLELVIGAVNATTIGRIWRDDRQGREGARRGCASKG